MAPVTTESDSPWQKAWHDFGFHSPRNFLSTLLRYNWQDKIVIYSKCTVWWFDKCTHSPGNFRSNWLYNVLFSPPSHSHLNQNLKPKNLLTNTFWWEESLTLGKPEDYQHGEEHCEILPKILGHSRSPFRSNVIYAVHKYSLSYLIRSRCCAGNWERIQGICNRIQQAKTSKKSPKVLVKILVCRSPPLTWIRSLGAEP